ncbi:MAG: glycosyltransferase [Nitrospiraceae bacterium]
MTVFESNVARIAENDPILAVQIRESSGGVLEILESRNGMATATCGDRWVHSSYDPRQEAERWAEGHLAVWQSNEIAVILGVGLLYHVEALCKRSRTGVQIAVVVPDLRELHDACRARDLGDWIGLVRWIVGPAGEAAQTLASFSQPLRLLTYAPAADCHADSYAALETSLREALAVKMGGRLHVAVVGPIYGGSLPIARYTASALKQLGHRVTWIDHSFHHGSYEAMAGLSDGRHRQLLQAKFAELLSQWSLARVAEDPPDLILALAQAPLTLPVLEHLRRKKFLTSMWFVENYRHLTYWQQVAGGYDYWFVIQQDRCHEAMRWAGAKQIEYLPMAADPAVHRPLELSEAERREFGADVAFVGAGYANRRALLPRLTSSEWTFKIWGNEWEGAAAVQPALQRGGARVDTETCVKIFNATAINLNLHSHVGTGFDPEGDFVNPRTFELAACRAFQLVDRRRLLPNLFDSGQIATLTDEDGLVRYLQTWRQEPEARRVMAQEAYDRTLREHTYVHRMKTLLARIGMGEPDRVGAILRGDRQAGRLAEQSRDTPELIPLLRQGPDTERVELRDLAARIKAKGATATLGREELLILLLDEHRSDMRDLL